jgi:hypothetical protein
MGAGHGHAVLEAHEFGEHFGPRDDRDGIGDGRLHLRVGWVYGRGNHDHVRARNLFGRMPDKDRTAQVLQALGYVRTAQVRSGNRIAQVQEQLSDPAHTDSAYADISTRLSRLPASSFITSAMTRPSRSFWGIIRAAPAATSARALWVW